MNYAVSSFDMRHGLNQIFPFTILRQQNVLLDDDCLKAFVTVELILIDLSTYPTYGTLIRLISGSRVGGLL